jgi:hypothetical protein
MRNFMALLTLVVAAFAQSFMLVFRCVAAPEACCDPCDRMSELTQ